MNLTLYFFHFISSPFNPRELGQRLQLGLNQWEVADSTIRKQGPTMEADRGISAHAEASFRSS